MAITRLTKVSCLKGLSIPPSVPFWGSDSETKISTYKKYTNIWRAWNNISIIFSELKICYEAFSRVLESRIWHIFRTCSALSNFVRKISSFFETKILFWHKHLIFTQKFFFDTKVLFWHKSPFLTQKSYFDTNILIWHKNPFLTQKSLFDTKILFWHKHLFLTQKSFFGTKILFRHKNLFFRQKNPFMKQNPFLIQKIIFTQKSYFLLEQIFNFWQKIIFSKKIFNLKLFTVFRLRRNGVRFADNRNPVTFVFSLKREHSWKPMNLQFLSII